MLDEPLKDFIVIPAGLPWKGVKRLATSGERVNHDLCRVFKTGILAVLTVTSGLGDSYIKGDESCFVNMLLYCLMLYIIYVTLIMRPWDLYYLVAILAEFVLDSFLLSPPHLRRSIGLVINQSG